MFYSCYSIICVQQCFLPAAPLFLFSFLHPVLLQEMLPRFPLPLQFLLSLLFNPLANGMLSGLDGFVISSILVNLSYCFLKIEATQEY